MFSRTINPFYAVLGITVIGGFMTLMIVRAISSVDFTRTTTLQSLAVTKTP